MTARQETIATHSHDHGNLGAPWRTKVSVQAKVSAIMALDCYFRCDGLLVIAVTKLRMR
jgi:hypothetical protein